MSANCRDCGAPISFGDHPTSPGKLAPFDSDGKLHWKTCKKPRKNVFKTLEEIPPCGLCKGSAKYVYKKINEKTKALQIGVRCGNLHWITWLPKDKQNFALVNTTEDKINSLLTRQIEAAYD